LPCTTPSNRTPIAPGISYDISQIADKIEAWKKERGVDTIFGNDPMIKDMTINRSIKEGNVPLPFDENRIRMQMAKTREELQTIVKTIRQPKGLKVKRYSVQNM
jgi:hypothetical protein